MTRYRNPTPTVDIAIVDDSERIVVVQRGREPFRGRWVLPGGFVEYGETVEQAAVREALEETGLEVDLRAILGVYSDPRRDPRGHTITTVFVARPVGGELRGGDDASAARWAPLSQLRRSELAFDHGLIVRDLLVWIRHGGTFWSTKRRD